MVYRSWYSMVWFMLLLLGLEIVVVLVVYQMGRPDSEGPLFGSLGQWWSQSTSTLLGPMDLREPFRGSWLVGTYHWCQRLGRDPGRTIAWARYWLEDYVRVFIAQLG
ncbi:hypothetical protein BJ085DRAFT_36006 [Dimargaris cristalligena]|uniref:Uncharacterized protein n=1 Tax=Dimargaris cristalligena TaxID=215637 RepID=A0A4P9ZMB0_9FUNG|nr:hypothetical protein BJ085DRAFT_36006 [Dimargaris cristalligena]|eukprot:RKP33681.1 hypothetical protein BJ085DRAFT_36006 [Dimargaris cristalligena]